MIPLIPLQARRRLTIKMSILVSLSVYTQLSFPKIRPFLSAFLLTFPPQSQPPFCLSTSTHNKTWGTNCSAFGELSRMHSPCFTCWDPQLLLFAAVAKLPQCTDPIGALQPGLCFISGICLCVCPMFWDSYVCVCLSVWKSLLESPCFFLLLQKHTLLMCLRHLQLTQNNEFLHSTRWRQQVPTSRVARFSSLALLQPLMNSEPDQWKVPVEALLWVTKQKASRGGSQAFCSS